MKTFKSIFAGIAKNELAEAKDAKKEVLNAVDSLIRSLNQFSAAFLSTEVSDMPGANKWMQFEQYGVWAKGLDSAVQAQIKKLADGKKQVARDRSVGNWKVGDLVSIPKGTLVAAKYDTLYSHRYANLMDLVRHNVTGVIKDIDKRNQYLVVDFGDAYGGVMNVRRNHVDKA